jgi:hypothetical protein
LVRPGDTRLGSHYKTLIRIESMWESVIEVLEIVNQEEHNPSRAGGLVQSANNGVFQLCVYHEDDVANPPHHK